MRYFALVLSTGITLFSIPAAAAVRGDASRDAIVVGATCPKMEGYPDCRPDDAGRVTNSRNVSRARA
jgi:7-cyano-7-deazaguanine synthase in queuosine biosynthesis